MLPQHKARNFFLVLCMHVNKLQKKDQAKWTVISHLYLSFEPRLNRFLYEERVRTGKRGGGEGTDNRVEKFAAGPLLWYCFSKIYQTAAKTKKNENVNDTEASLVEVHCRLYAMPKWCPSGGGPWYFAAAFILFGIIGDN